ncbi:MAG: hypothetical protein HDQ88_05610 [Clostridia bacterium]|nr:hypothetical protein [Clostridia bacterium]
MKVFKKVTAFAVAMTMGCSIMAFTACGPNDDDKDKGANNLPKGTPAQAIDATFAEAIEQETNYATLKYSNTESVTETYYQKVNGVLDNDYTNTSTHEINMTVNGTIDLKEGNADLVAKSVAEYNNDKNKEDFTGNLEYNNFLSYCFVRDWNSFVYDTPDNKEVTDFTGKELEYGSSLKIDWEEILKEMGSVGDMVPDISEGAVPVLGVLPQTGDLVKLSLLGENYALVKLASAANTIETVDGGYSIDLIKTVETVLKEVGSVVYALNGDNTVGDILKNDIVKKYFSIITELVPVEDVKDAVASAIDALYKEENLKDLINLYFKSDLEGIKSISANDTYDYIVALISSENLKNVLNTVAMIAMQLPGGGASPMASAPSNGAVSSDVFTKTLDKYTVNEILTIVNEMAQPTLPITLDVLKNAYKNYIEVLCDGNKLYVNSDPDDTAVLTTLSVEYKLENGKLASQKVSYAYGREYTHKFGESIIESNGSVTTTASTYSEVKETQEGTVELIYGTTAPTLTDISENVVNYVEYVWDENDLQPFNIGYYDYNLDQYVERDFYLGAVVADDGYISYQVYAEDQTTVLAIESDIFYIENKAFRVVEYDRYFSDTYSYISVEYLDKDGEYYGWTRITPKELNKQSTVAEMISANA